MPPTLSYPGVYVTELSSGVRTITGVATSIAAFVGPTARGPLNKAVRIFSFSDFDRQFGGLNRNSEVSFAVRQFFLNGGQDAYVVRTAEGALKATVGIAWKVPAVAVDAVLEIEAREEGEWANDYRLEIRHDTADPDNTFHLNVWKATVAGSGTTLSLIESLQDLSMSPAAANPVEDTLKSQSRTVTAKVTATPAQITGAAAATSVSGTINFAQVTGVTRRIAVSVDGNPSEEVDVFPPGAPPATLALLAAALQNALTLKFPMASFTAAAAGNTLTITRTFVPANTQTLKGAIRISPASIDDAARVLKLGLPNGGTEKTVAGQLRPAVTGTFIFGTVASLNTAVITPTLTVMGVTRAFAATNPLAVDPADGPATIARKIQTALNSTGDAEAWKLATGGIEVKPAGSGWLISTGTGLSGVTLELAVTQAGNTVQSNVQTYAAGSVVAGSGQVGGIAGVNGTLSASPGSLLGDQLLQTGIYAMDAVDLFNILCLPDCAIMKKAQALPVYAEATAFCEKRRAFFILDVPDDVINPAEDPGTSAAKFEEFFSDNGTLRHKNAATYFPRLLIPDPTNAFRLRTVAASGTMAGLFARTDSERGVWKSPAGTEAQLRGVDHLEFKLNDAQNGPLNLDGLNVLRSFPDTGNVSWGARTLLGNSGNDWKYVAVRRTALFIEESLYRGTQFCVFEPNDEPLWSQIRLNVGAFMQGLFRRGAFQGQTAREAYFVKCDKETTTQDDINQGIVNILVGFAPLKPAEFVVVTLTQIAGDIAT